MYIVNNTTNYTSHTQNGWETCPFRCINSWLEYLEWMNIIFSYRYIYMYMHVICAVITICFHPDFLAIISMKLCAGITLHSHSFDIPGCRTKLKEVYKFLALSIIGFPTKYIDTTSSCSCRTLSFILSAALIVWRSVELRQSAGSR